MAGRTERNKQIYYQIYSKRILICWQQSFINSGIRCERASPPALTVPLVCSWSRSSLVSTFSFVIQICVAFTSSFPSYFYCSLLSVIVVRSAACSSQSELYCLLFCVIIYIFVIKHFSFWAPAVNLPWRHFRKARPLILWIFILKSMSPVWKFPR